MKSLINRIIQDGHCLEGGILKVDRFINHQMDPYLMKQVAVEFMNRFAQARPTKILTVEASGFIIEKEFQGGRKALTEAGSSARQEPSEPLNASARDNRHSYHENNKNTGSHGRHPNI